jgi:hypothetical protein
VSRVRAQITVPPDRPIVEAETLWYDLSRRSSFIDGFAHVAKVDDDWPAAGTLIWDSTPAGRGRVVERVVWHDVRVGQDAEIEDPKITGLQRIRFAPGAVALELDYRLKDRNPLLDLFFVRRAMGDALRRTMNRFAIELRTERELTDESIR